MAHPISTTRARASSVAIAVFLSLATAGFSIAAPCPPSIVQLGRAATPFTVTTPAYDSTYLSVVIQGAHASFDRTAARMSLVCRSIGGLTASIRVVERFDLTGVVAGTPVNATLELALDGWAEQSCGGSGCGVEFEGRLRAGTDSVTADANIQGPSTPLHRTLSPSVLSLPVTLTAGAPFEAQFFLTYGTGPGQADARGEVTGTYRVAGLPAGVHVVACYGADVTPATRTTWGRLKTRYR